MSSARHDSTPYLNISEVADNTGITAYTLRYYDKCGFFPNLYRDKNNTRRFSDSDVDHLKLVDALRKSGLSIEGIRYFVKLQTNEKNTYKEQRDIIKAQEVTLEYQLSEIKENLKTLREELSQLNSFIELNNP